jgi:hypothetical protein
LKKIYVKAVDKESEVFAYLRQKFLKISETKIKERVFFGPQNTQLFEHQDFSTKLNSTERRAWKAFGKVCTNFIGHKKVEKCSEILQQLFSPKGAVGLTCH